MKDEALRLLAELGDLALQTEQAERRILAAARARLAALSEGDDAERAILLEVIKRSRGALAAAGLPG
ncbi:MAG: hypothetical protein AB7E55_06735 [Pigmentiphaga sp.]